METVIALEKDMDYMCGVVKFIEFLLTKGLDIKKCVQEKIPQMRFNTCVSLYDHGLQKWNGMYESDDD